MPKQLLACGNYFSSNNGVYIKPTTSTLAHEPPACIRDVFLLMEGLVDRRSLTAEIPTLVGECEMNAQLGYS